MEFNQLAIAKFRFTLIALEKIVLPNYKGSTFHGGFGHALKDISPIWFSYFFKTEQYTDLPKPFVLLPPLDEKTHYQAGEQFTIELTLFGEATRHYAICQAAIEYLGQKMGLGFNQGKYQVVNIVKSSPVLFATPNSSLRLAIRLPTRLRLKHNNRLCKLPPPFPVFYNRLSGRLETLQNHYGDKHECKDHKAALLEQAKTIKMVSPQTRWDDWNRFSGRQKTWMKFGGLLGNIRYEGDLGPFYPTLQLGQWTHIGGKTSFGLGKYEIDHYGETA